MLPQAFLDRIQVQLGEEYPDFLESLERPRAVALRFNPLKGEVPQLPFVQEPVPWEPMGYYYNCSTLVKFKKIAHYLFLVSCIKRRCRFIEKNIFWFVEDCSRNKNALYLSST